MKKILAIVLMLVLSLTLCVPTYAASAKTSLKSVKLAESSYTYTGKAIKPAVTVKAKVNGKTKTLKKGTDYTVSYQNNKNVGTATVTVKGKGKYKGTLTKSFKIKKAAITNATIKNASLKWTGKARTQTKSTAVYCGDKLLTRGKDYKITYANNVDIGTATMTITGKGNYKGTLTKTFEIMHEHSWTTETETIHHDAVTKKVVDTPAYDETKYEDVWVVDVPAHEEKGEGYGVYVCSKCHYATPDIREMMVHMKNSCKTSYYNDTMYGDPIYVEEQGHWEQQPSGTIHHDEVSHIEVITPAYDETITHTYCSVCGATK